MNATDTIYAVATRATRLGWLEDEEGNGYHLEDDIHDLVATADSRLVRRHFA